MGSEMCIRDRSVSVSFRVRVVRASGRARRSGVGAYGASASNAGGPVANMLAGPAGLGGRLLRRRNGFKLFWSNVYYMQWFSAVGLFWLRRCKGFKEMQLQNLEHIVRRNGFKAFLIPKAANALLDTRVLNLWVCKSLLCNAKPKGFKAWRF